MSSSDGGRGRHRFRIAGLVQGVGFRPFTYALARELNLSGSVRNTTDGLIVEAEGRPADLDQFRLRLVTGAPPAAQVASVSTEVIAVRGGTDFTIARSEGGAGRTLVSPDLGVCGECLAELADPDDRRYRHPFISCTNCGPRFSVIWAAPYDRPATTLVDFPMCARCAAEYTDPANRRFHAQTIACWECGPTVRLVGGDDEAHGAAAIAEARRLIAAGRVLAVKGIGGYHLACDATSALAVASLRERKRRGDKPFAVMVATASDAEQIAEVSPAEHALLTDIRHPVVLLPRRWDPRVPVADGVAPGCPHLGVLVAYTPLHRLLFGLPGDPPGPRVLVMTSGNLSGEPIVISDAEARDRLAGVADAWLTHDRRIHVPGDDSVIRMAAGAYLPVRRSRGYAPMPVALPFHAVPSLAVGGDNKNTFCLAEGGYAWLSSHIGDMDDVATIEAFGVAVDHLSALMRVSPEVLVVDQHPAYRSAAWARSHSDGRPVRRVQHHHAHIAAAMAENGQPVDTPVIGFAFDGTGFGDDGAVWGGEVLLATYDDFRRVGHLAYVPLPGADAGVRNPCRMALSHLYRAGVDWAEALPCVAACDPVERSVLLRQFQTGLGCVSTSSMGRLFDAMSSLAGVCHRADFEAEAAMRFEGLAGPAVRDETRPYRFGVHDRSGVHVLDCTPVIAAASADVLAGVAAPVIAARFHLAVADVVIDVSRLLRERTGVTTVALSGGVFLNAVLTELCVERLRRGGFQVLRHQIVPPSDAGLALGQIAVAARHPADGEASG